MSYILKRMVHHKVLLALAPHSQDTLLMEILEEFKRYLIKNHGKDSHLILKIFPSASKLDKYMSHRDYDSPKYEDGKIGLALILEAANKSTVTWSYSIRKMLLFARQCAFAFVCVSDDGCSDRCEPLLHL